MTRPRKPRRQAGLRWIYPRWREAAQRWEWFPAVRIAGKLVWGASHPDQEAAFEAAKDMRSRHAVVVRIGDLTLKQACDRAVARLLANGGSRHTAKGYESRFGKWQEILSADALVTDITADDIEHLKAERRRLHEVGSNTVRTDLVLMQRVLDLAGLTGDKNPVRTVERPKVPEPHRPFLTMDEVRSIADRIRSSSRQDCAWHATVVTFLAMTGARAFEIERLRPQHLEEPEGGGVCIVLHGAKGSRQAARRVFVAPGLSAVAREFVGHQPPIAPTTISTICKRLAKRLGEPRLSGRVLRRTFATEVARHVPIQYVQQFLGHSQLTTTQKYLGVDPRLARAAAAALHSSLAGTSPPACPQPAPCAARRSARGPAPTRAAAFACSAWEKGKKESRRDEARAVCEMPAPSVTAR